MIFIVCNLKVKLFGGEFHSAILRKMRCGAQMFSVVNGAINDVISDAIKDAIKSW